MINESNEKIEYISYKKLKIDYLNKVNDPSNYEQI